MNEAPEERGDLFAQARLLSQLIVIICLASLLLVALGLLMGGRHDAQSQALVEALSLSEISIAPSSEPPRATTPGSSDLRFVPELPRSPLGGAQR